MHMPLKSHRVYSDLPFTSHADVAFQTGNESIFPWITKKFAKAEEPEYIIDLNVRAMVQVMREAGVEIGDESDEEILDADKKLRNWVQIPLGGSQEANVPAAVGRRLSSANQTPNDSVAVGAGSMEM